MSHLLYLHAKVYFSESKWHLGAETIYMMSICKFSSVAFNYDDGDKKEEDLKATFFKKK